MEAGMKICLVLFALVSLGNTDVIQSDVEDSIQACYDDSFYGESQCRDYDAVVTCLKKIDPEDDLDKMSVESAIEYEQEQKTACPDLNTKEQCIEVEVSKCMEKYRDLHGVKDYQVCKEVLVAKACLVTFNNTCLVDVVGYESDELDLVSRQCASGHWDEGPCHPQHVFNCTVAVFEDLDLDTFQFRCQAVHVVSAKRCLSGLKTTCRTPMQTQEIEDEWDILNEMCPPAK